MTTVVLSALTEVTMRRHLGTPMTRTSGVGVAPASALVVAVIAVVVATPRQGQAAANAVTEGQVSLLTHPNPGPPYLTALAMGVLRERGDGRCLYLQKPGATPQLLLVWPDHFAAKKVADGSIRILDATGEVVAIGGRMITVTGGILSRSSVKECAGETSAFEVADARLSLSSTP